MALGRQGMKHEYAATIETELTSACIAAGMRDPDEIRELVVAVSKPIVDGFEATANELRSKAAAELKRQQMALENARRLHDKVGALTKALEKAGYRVTEEDGGITVHRVVGAGHERATSPTADSPSRPKVQSTAERLAAARVT